MNNIIEYFSNVPDSHRIILICTSMFLLWNIENSIGLNFNYKKWKHAFTNSLFTIFDIPVQFLLGIAFVFSTKWATAHHWGLLNWFHIKNMWLLFLVTFIVLDFCEYVYHVIMHKVKRLWMFHLVHHSDRVIDVSSTLREHPGETTIRLSFLVLWVCLSGAAFWAILFRQFIQILSNVFAHSNFRIPVRIDRIISCVFVTPNFHHVHHHYQQPYTDSNYGDVLSIWDRLFGTFRTLSAEKTIFGVDSCMKECDNANFKNLIMMPFGKYRPAVVDSTRREELVLDKTLQQA
ncbi:sterol desaturase family protein [Emticicia sp.]|uniref:sterol desaturase family protein n=1 Tax=Emticicia sp. TaxID=1930953 RepID=UPI00375080D3